MSTSVSEVSSDHSLLSRFNETAHLTNFFLNQICIESLFSWTLQCSACVYKLCQTPNMINSCFHSNWTYNQQKWLSSPYWSGHWQYYVEVCVWKDYMWLFFMIWRYVCKVFVILIFLILQNLLGRWQWLKPQRCSLKTGQSVTVTCTFNSDPNCCNNRNHFLAGT